MREHVGWWSNTSVQKHERRSACDGGLRDACGRSVSCRLVVASRESDHIVRQRPWTLVKSRRCGPRSYAGVTRTIVNATSTMRKSEGSCRDYPKISSSQLPIFPASWSRAKCKIVWDVPIHTSGCEASPGSVGDFDETLDQLPNYQLPAALARRPAFCRFRRSSFPASRGVLAPLVACATSSFPTSSPPRAASGSRVQLPESQLPSPPLPNH